MSTPSEAAKPFPDTVTVEVGGPVAAESSASGVTVKLLALAAVPAGVVTLKRAAEDGVSGTVAVILEEERTVNTDATPWNLSTVAPVKPVPLMITTVPTGPVVGVKDLI